MQIPSDEVKLDILYKIYKGSYESALKYARKVSGKNYEAKDLKSFDEFKEYITYKANDAKISEEYKLKKKGIQYLAEMLGKEDVRHFNKKQAIGVLTARKGFDKDNIPIHELAKMMYNSEEFLKEISAQIRLRYKDLRDGGIKDTYALKALISQEFFGSE